MVVRIAPGLRQPIANMADVQETHFDVDEDQRVSKIKKELEGWREILLPVNKMLTWQKPVYPAVLTAVITFIFILVWYFDPSVLTTFSAIGLIVTLTDYLVPTVAAKLFRNAEWTGDQEREFENICIRIHNARVHLHNFRIEYSKLKQEKPTMHVILVTVTLALFTWVGSLIDNLLLTYLIVIFLTLLPGMRERGMLQKYAGQVRDFVKSTINKHKQKRS